MPGIKPYECAYFSLKIYKGSCKKKRKLGFGTWEFLDDSGRNNPYGYYAGAYKDDVRNLIVIVHRGTHFKADLITDVQIALKKQPGASKEAFEFSKHIREAFNSDGRYRVVEVGHSLGGFYAELNGVEFPGTFVRSFDSPGIGHLIGNRIVDSQKFECYVTAPNPINTGNEKFGQLVRIFVPHYDVDKHHLESASEKFVTNPLDAVLKFGASFYNFILHTHSMKNLFEAMSSITGEPYLQRKVVSWPSRLGYLEYLANLKSYNLGKYLLEHLSLYTPANQINRRYEATLSNLGGYSLAGDYIFHPFEANLALGYKKAFIKHVFSLYFYYHQDVTAFKRLVEKVQQVAPGILPPEVPPQIQASPAGDSYVFFKTFLRQVGNPNPGEVVVADVPEHDEIEDFMSLYITPNLT